MAAKTYCTASASFFGAAPKLYPCSILALSQLHPTYKISNLEGLHLGSWLKAAVWLLEPSHVFLE